MVKAYGLQMAERLQQRLQELQAANSLLDMSHLPPARCHELVNRKGVFSVNLEHPYRLLFVPADDPIPKRADGGILLSSVTEVEVISIEDTHDSKKKRRG